MEINVKEAAKRLNVTELTIRNYIKKGRLKAQKKIKGLRFSYLIEESELQKISVE